MWSNKASITCLNFIAGLHKRRSIRWLKSTDHCGHMCFGRLAHQFKYQATGTQAFQINDFYSSPGGEENENKMIWLS